LHLIPSKSRYHSVLIWLRRNPEGGDMQTLETLWKGEEAQDLTEYALLLVLIALLGVASLRVAGQAVSDAFSNAAANLTTTT
jgi:Flp pilus assembly pilin Flp